MWSLRAAQWDQWGGFWYVGALIPARLHWSEVALAGCSLGSLDRPCRSASLSLPVLQPLVSSHSLFVFSTSSRRECNLTVSIWWKIVFTVTSGTRYRGSLQRASLIWLEKPPLLLRFFSEVTSAIIEFINPFKPNLITPRMHGGWAENDNRHTSEAGRIPPRLLWELRGGPVFTYQLHSHNCNLGEFL